MGIGIYLAGIDCASTSCPVWPGMNGTSCVCLERVAFLGVRDVSNDGENGIGVRERERSELDDPRDDGRRGSSCPQKAGRRDSIKAGSGSHSYN